MPIASPKANRSASALTSSNSPIRNCGVTACASGASAVVDCLDLPARHADHVGDCGVRAEPRRVDGHAGDLSAEPAEHVGHHDRVEAEVAGDGLGGAQVLFRESTDPCDLSAHDRRRVNGWIRLRRRHGRCDGRHIALSVCGEHGGLFAEQRDEIVHRRILRLGRGDRVRAVPNVVGRAAPAACSLIQNRLAVLNE